MSRELLQQALDALETKYSDYIYDGAGSAIAGAFEDDVAALREALAAPVEPVYWQWRRKSTPWSTEYIFNSQAHATSPDSEVRALYTTPPAQPPIDGFGGNLDSAFDVNAVPDGWVMVPREATRDMCVAAVVLNNGNAVYKNVKAEALEIEEQIYAEVYEAMIAAAPGSPPVAPATPAVNCEWTNCPRRVGDVCCNDRPAAPAVPTMTREELVAAAESIGMRMPTPAVPAVREPQDNDCTPNHYCNGRIVHLPDGEMCERCGHE